MSVEKTERSADERAALDQALELVADLDEETALMVLVGVAMLGGDIPSVSDADGDIHAAVRTVLEADPALFVQAAMLVLLFEAGAL